MGPGHGQFSVKSYSLRPQGHWKPCLGTNQGQEGHVP